MLLKDSRSTNFRRKGGGEEEGKLRESIASQELGGTELKESNFFLLLYRFESRGCFNSAVKLTRLLGRQE